MISTEGFPDWFAPLLTVVAQVQPHQLGPVGPLVGRELRRSAVLVLFAEGATGPVGRSAGEPDVLLTERAESLRSHAGQVAFPGGALDPGEDPVTAALREGQEETGLDPAGVQVAGALPDVYLVASDFVVTPVLAWWRVPSPIAPVTPDEVAQVVRVPVAELVDPDNRFRVCHPRGNLGPGFTASGLFIWGFTAGLLDRLLHLAGWERPWDEARVLPCPPSATGRRPTEPTSAVTPIVTESPPDANSESPPAERPNREPRP